jgi:hypothetical protein
MGQEKGWKNIIAKCKLKIAKFKMKEEGTRGRASKSKGPGA